MLKRFKIDNLKESATPLAQHFKFSSSQKPQDERERKEMEVIPYANMIGSVMYAMVCTRPDIAQAVSLTSTFMADPGREHWLALKWLLRYLKGAARLQIMYGGNKIHNGDALMGFYDSNYAGDTDNRRSQTRYVFTMFGSAISWKSSQRHVVAFSTTEAEYLALAAAIKESF